MGDQREIALPPGRPEHFPTRIAPLATPEVTFKGGLDQAAHSWFRLTYSFSPHLVAFLIDRLDTRRPHWVLDPFLGAGTTAIECKRRGISVVGIDVNPLFVKLGRVCTTWALDVSHLQRQTRRILDQACRRLAEAGDLTVEDFGQRIGAPPPPIRNLARWWRVDVLKALLALKQSIRTLATPGSTVEFFEGALAAILLEVANIHRNHPTLTFCDRAGDAIDVLGVFEAQVARMLHELTDLARLDGQGTCLVIEGDSTRLGEVLRGCAVLAGVRFDRVITSPPYPNRISYVWETRPHLYFLDLFQEAWEAGALDQRTIGGTWGVATSTLLTGEVVPVDTAVTAVVGPLASAVRERDNLMANYVVKYFNMLYQHLRELRGVLAAGARCAYVVGNSRLKGIDVYTDVILAELFCRLGFVVEEIQVMRQRGGRKRLYEAVVVAAWQPTERATA